VRTRSRPELERASERRVGRVPARRDEAHLTFVFGGTRRAASRKTLSLVVGLASRSTHPTAFTLQFKGFRRWHLRGACRFRVSASPNSIVSFRGLFYGVRATVSPMSIVESRLFRA
jgi:hypothetical protein